MLVICQLCRKEIDLEEARKRRLLWDTIDTSKPPGAPDRVTGQEEMQLLLCPECEAAAKTMYQMKLYGEIFKATNQEGLLIWQEIYNIPGTMRIAPGMEYQK